MTATSYRTYGVSLIALVGAILASTAYSGENGRLGFDFSEPAPGEIAPNPPPTEEGRPYFRTYGPSEDSFVRNHENYAPSHGTAPVPDRVSRAGAGGDGGSRSEINPLGGPQRGRTRTGERIRRELGASGAYGGQPRPLRESGSTSRSFLEPPAAGERAAIDAALAPARERPPTELRGGAGDASRPLPTGAPQARQLLGQPRHSDHNEEIVSGEAAELTQGPQATGSGRRQPGGRGRTEARPGRTDDGASVASHPGEHRREGGDAELRHGRAGNGGGRDDVAHPQRTGQGASEASPNVNASVDRPSGPRQMPRARTGGGGRGRSEVSQHERPQLTGRVDELGGGGQTATSAQRVGRGSSVDGGSHPVSSESHGGGAGDLREATNQESAGGGGQAAPSGSAGRRGADGANHGGRYDVAVAATGPYGRFSGLVSNGHLNLAHAPSSMRGGEMTNYSARDRVASAPEGAAAGREDFPLSDPGATRDGEQGLQSALAVVPGAGRQGGPASRDAGGRQGARNAGSDPARGTDSPARTGSWQQSSRGRNGGRRAQEPHADAEWQDGAGLQPGQRGESSPGNPGSRRGPRAGVQGDQGRAETPQDGSRGGTETTPGGPPGAGGHGSHQTGRQGGPSGRGTGERQPSSGNPSAGGPGGPQAFRQGEQGNGRPGEQPNRQPGAPGAGGGSPRSAGAGASVAGARQRGAQGQPATGAQDGQQGREWGAGAGQGGRPAGGSHGVSRMVQAESRGGAGMGGDGAHGDMSGAPPASSAGGRNSGVAQRLGMRSDRGGAGAYPGSSAGAGSESVVDGGRNGNQRGGRSGGGSAPTGGMGGGRAGSRMGGPSQGGAMGSSQHAGGTPGTLPDGTQGLNFAGRPAQQPGLRGGEFGMAGAVPSSRGGGPTGSGANDGSSQGAGGNSGPRGGVASGGGAGGRRNSGAGMAGGDSGLSTGDRTGGGMSGAGNPRGSPTGGAGDVGPFENTDDSRGAPTGGGRPGSVAGNELGDPGGGGAVGGSPLGATGGEPAGSMGGLGTPRGSAMSGGQPGGLPGGDSVGSGGMPGGSMGGSAGSAAGGGSGSMAGGSAGGVGGSSGGSFGGGATASGNVAIMTNALNTMSGALSGSWMSQAASMSSESAVQSLGPAARTVQQLEPEMQALSSGSPLPPMNGGSGAPQGAPSAALGSDMVASGGGYSAGGTMGDATGGGDTGPTGGRQPSSGSGGSGLGGSQGNAGSQRGSAPPTGGRGGEGFPGGDTGSTGGGQPSGGSSAGGGAQLASATPGGDGGANGVRGGGSSAPGGSGSQGTGNGRPQTAGQGAGSGGASSGSQGRDNVGGEGDSAAHGQSASASGGGSDVGGGAGRSPGGAGASGGSSGGESHDLGPGGRTAQQFGLGSSDATGQSGDSGTSGSSTSQGGERGATGGGPSAPGGSGSQVTGSTLSDPALSSTPPANAADTTPMSLGAYKATYNSVDWPQHDRIENALQSGASRDNFSAQELSNFDKGETVMKNYEVNRDHYNRLEENQKTTALETKFTARDVQREAETGATNGMIGTGLLGTIHAAEAAAHASIASGHPVAGAFGKSFLAGKKFGVSANEAVKSTREAYDRLFGETSGSGSLAGKISESGGNASGVGSGSPGGGSGTGGESGIGDELTAAGKEIYATAKSLSSAGKSTKEIYDGIKDASETFPEMARNGPPADKFQPEKPTLRERIENNSKTVEALKKAVEAYRAGNYDDVPRHLGDAVKYFANGNTDFGPNAASGVAAIKSFEQAGNAREPVEWLKNYVEGWGHGMLVADGLVPNAGAAGRSALSTVKTIEFGQEFNRFSQMPENVRRTMDPIVERINSNVQGTGAVFGDMRNRLDRRKRPVMQPEIQLHRTP